MESGGLQADVDWGINPKKNDGFDFTASLNLFLVRLPSISLAVSFLAPDKVTMSQMQQLWTKWKMMRLPWRKKFLIGESI